MRNTQLVQNSQSKFLSHLLVVYVQDGTAHYYCLVVQALSRGHTHKRAYLSAATGLTEYGYVVRVTAKL